MSKRTVTITFSVDTSEYADTPDTPQGAIELAADTVRGDLDFPEEDAVVISCEDEERVLAEVGMFDAAKSSA